MSRAGIFAAICGVAYPRRLERLVEIEAAQGRRSDAVLRLAALTVARREDVERLRGDLRLSNGENDRLARAATLVEAQHGREAHFTLQELNELIFVNGRRGALDALALLQADSSAAPDDPAWRGAAQFLETAPAPAFPLKAEDLMRRGLSPGRELGLALKRLQAAWIRAGFPTEPRRVMQLLEEATRQSDASR